MVRKGFYIYLVGCVDAHNELLWIVVDVNFSC